MKTDSRKVEKGRKMSAVLFLDIKEPYGGEIYEQLQAQETYQLELTLFSAPNNP